jgi:hypothetical protein
MPKYRVEALEQFLVRTVYYVEASSPAEAEALCQSGDVAYEEKEITEDNDVWVETLSVEEC